jgi:ABC-type sugar transport system ATPase subunit
VLTLIRRKRAAGTSAVIICHRLGDLRDWVGTATVLGDGTVVATLHAAGLADAPRSCA